MNRFTLSWIPQPFKRTMGTRCMFQYIQYSFHVHESTGSRCTDSRFPTTQEVHAPNLMRTRLHAVWQAFCEMTHIVLAVIQDFTDTLPRSLHAAPAFVSRVANTRCPQRFTRSRIHAVSAVARKFTNTSFIRSEIKYAAISAVVHKFPSEINNTRRIHNH